MALSGCSSDSLSTATSTPTLKSSAATIARSTTPVATPMTSNAASVQSAASVEAARVAAQQAAASQARARQSAALSAAAQSASKQSVALSAASQSAAERSTAEAAASQAAADRLASAYDRASQLQDAASAAGWSGPVCSPDTNLHRERAGQPLLSDDELAAECEGQIAEAEAMIADSKKTEQSGAEGWYTPNGNWVSPDTAARALAAGISPGDTVPDYLRCGTICGEGPTSGEVQMAHLCKDGQASAEQCAGIDADAIIAAAMSGGG